MKKHKQVSVTANGKTFKVDEGVRQLVLLVNRFPKLETLNSCQGDEDFAGYVEVAGEGTSIFVAALTDRIIQAGAAWKRRHRHHVCHGCQGMSVALEVRNTAVLRWMPWDHELVLKLLGSIVRRQQ